MADTSKINIRFSNFGLNLAHDRSTLPFGKYAKLTNLVSDYEGNLRSRLGQTQLNPTAITGSPIVQGLRRLNDSVAGTAKYLVRAGTDLFVSNGVASPITFGAALSSSHAATFGSIIPYRPNISAQVWAYIGDATKMVKTDGTSVHTIGYTRPTGVVTIASEAAGGALTETGTYYYRYAWYSSTTGAESRFNSGGDSSQTLTGVNNLINLSIPAATVQPGVTKVRIYRKGGTIDTWRLLVTLAYVGGVTPYADDNADSAVEGNLVLDEDSDQPFITTNAAGTDVAGQPLPYLCDPVFGYVLAVGDPDNPGYLYWANKFDPDRQDPDNRVEVTSPQDPLQNVVTFNGAPYVFSKEAIYEMVVGIGASTFTPIKTPSKHGLFTPQAITTGDQIYFLSKDGVYATTGGGEICLTDDEMRPIFNGYTTNGYSPIDFSQTQYIRLAYINNELWLMYVGTDNLTHFLIYNIRYGRWRAADFRVDTATLYVDEEATSRLLMGDSIGHLLLHSGTADAGGSPTTIPVILQTGFITLGAPLIHKEWGSVVFDVDPQGATITFSVYSNKGATLVASTTSSASSRTKVYLDLARTFAEDIQIDIQWASATAVPILYGYELMYRPEEPQQSTYHVVGVTHGVQGWQIVRSAYVTLRSTGTVNFNVEVYNDDGTITSTAYPITTTGDAGGAAGKIKKFIPFNPTKGKLFGYSLEAASGATFRFYPEESEIHVKPWITSFGYMAVNPFVGGGSSPDAGAFNQGMPGSASQGGSAGGGGGAGAGGSLANAAMGSAMEFLGAGGEAVPPPTSPSLAVDLESSTQYNTGTTSLGLAPRRQSGL